MTDDLGPMRRAIEAARTAAAAGDRPYGAALVSPDGQVLLVARNEQVTRADPTRHAEMVLVTEAARTLGDALRGSTVYASGEPCAMCAGALYWAGVRRIVYGAPQPWMAELAGGELLPLRCADVLAGASRPVQVDGPLLADEAAAVIREALQR